MKASSKMGNVHPVVAPAREVSMLFAALIGGQLLGESDRLARIAGAALIAFGVMALALG